MEKCSYVYKKVALITFIFVFIAGGGTYINKLLDLADNNIFEEYIEKKVEDAIGLEIDLSDTPEDSRETKYKCDIWRRD